MIKSESNRAFYHFFRNPFNEFNNKGARMLDSIYHIDLTSFFVIAF